MGAVRDIITRFSFKSDKGELKSVEKSVTRVTREMKRQQYQARRIRYQFRALRNQVLRMAAAYMGFRALRDLTVGLADDISELTTNAMMLGLSAKQLDALRVAFESLTLKGSQADAMMRYFVQGIADAQRGTGLASDALAKLGISAKSLKNLGAAEQLNAVLAKLKDVGSDSERMLIAQSIAGRRGGIFLAALAKKYDHVKGAIQSADEAGVLFGKKHRIYDQSAARLAVLKRQWRDIKIRIGETLMKALLPLMKALQRWLSDEKNRKALTTWLKRAGALIAVLVTSKVLASIYKFIKTLKILAVAILPKLISPLRWVVRLIMWIGSAISGTGAIIAAALAVVGFWAYVIIFRTRQLKAALKEAWAGFVLMIHDFGSLMVRMWDATVGKILDGVNKIVNGIKRAGSAIKGAASWVRGKVSSGLSSVGEFLGISGASNGSGPGMVQSIGRTVQSVNRQVTVGKVDVNISGSTAAPPGEIRRSVQTGIETGMGRVVATAGGA